MNYAALKQLGRKWAVQDSNILITYYQMHETT